MRLAITDIAEARLRAWKRIDPATAADIKRTIREAMADPLSGFRLDGTSPDSVWVKEFRNGLFIYYTFTDDVLRLEQLPKAGLNTEAAVELSDDEKHRKAVELMRQYLDNEKPKLGIFWYDYRNNVLFGVEKGDAELYINEGEGTIATYPKLHKTYWQKKHIKALRAGDTESVFYGEHDYTQIPRGRIFYDNGKYYVNVGDWINGYINGVKCIDKEKLKELILDEFNLPEDFIFRQDIHWDIGHGWSEEQF